LVQSYRHFVLWESCPEEFATELSENHEFALQWLEAGLPFVPAVFPQAWKDDKEISLLVV
jgi:hypothetical protein